MAILGINLNRENPEYTITDFSFWMPQFSQYMTTAEGQTMFNNLYPIANAKIFESIYGTDWKLAMSLCIAHYATLIGQQKQSPSGTTLGEVSGGGATRGVLSSASIGGFTKTYDLDRTMVGGDASALWWNQTSYGAQLMALIKTKAIPSILVVTNNNIPGAN